MNMPNRACRNHCMRWSCVAPNCSCHIFNSSVGALVSGVIVYDGAESLEVATGVSEVIDFAAPASSANAFAARDRARVKVRQYFIFIAVDFQFWESRNNF